MIELFRNIRNYIIQILDLVYRPFQKFIPPETFRYAATGGFNTSLDIFLYFFFYNFILNKQIVDFGFVAVSPHIAAFIFVVLLIFAAGAILKKKQNRFRFMSIIGYQSIGPKKGVAALKIGKEILILGATSNEIRLLRVFKESELELSEPESFHSKLQRIRSSGNFNPEMDSKKPGI